MMEAAAPMTISFAVKLQRSAFMLDVAFDGHEPLIALFGPSGSGKTTILHLIAGIERSGEGRISLGQRVFVDTSQRIFVPRHQRKTGLVFQDAQLFPHLSVRQNLMFGRRFSGSGPALLPFETVVETLGLERLLERRPHGLSGGEKQRVALARALLAGPQLLLMDEPLSSLDDERRNEIMGLIERVRDGFAIPIIYVTHAREEVRRLATKVVRIEAGRVVASGRVEDVLGLKA